MELDLLVDISNILIRGYFNTLHSRRYARNNYLAELWSGSEEGSRLTDCCITQL